MALKKLTMKNNKINSTKRKYSSIINSNTLMIFTIRVVKIH